MPSFNHVYPGYIRVFLLPIHKLNKEKKGFFLILCLIFISDWELARVSPAPEGLSGRPPGGVETEGGTPGTVTSMVLAGSEAGDWLIEVGHHLPEGRGLEDDYGHGGE